MKNRTALNTFDDLPKRNWKKEIADKLKEVDKLDAEHTKERDALVLEVLNLQQEESMTVAYIEGYKAAIRRLTV